MAKVLDVFSQSLTDHLYNTLRNVIVEYTSSGGQRKICVHYGIHRTLVHIRPTGRIDVDVESKQHTREYTFNISSPDVYDQILAVIAENDKYNVGSRPMSVADQHGFELEYVSNLGMTVMKNGRIVCSISLESDGTNGVWIHGKQSDKVATITGTVIALDRPKKKSPKTRRQPVN